MSPPPPYRLEAWRGLLSGVWWWQLRHPWSHRVIDTAGGYPTREAALADGQAIHPAATVTR